MSKAVFASRTARRGVLALVLMSCGGAKSASPDEGGSGGGQSEGGTGGAEQGTGGKAQGGSGGKGGSGGNAQGGSGGKAQGGSGGTSGTSGGTGGEATGGAGAVDAGEQPGPPDAGAGKDGPPPAMGGGGVVIGPSGFKHPGVVVNRGQLDFLKAKIAAGEQPWKGNFDALKGTSYASHGYQAKPVPTVECGPYSNPSIGCSDEWKDGMAAYAQALLWYFTGDESYARKSVDIMNAWSTTLKGHANSNGPLQQGWAGAEWPRAAEIIRYTYPGWAAADIERFKTMLKTYYLPGVINGSGANGNWELTMIDAAIGIGVFLDDKASFDKAVTMWKQRVPAYFYLSSDGPKPVPSPRGSTNWYGLTTYMDGVAQETCRDLVHTQYGIASTMYIAETALIQGVDLYALEQKRLAAAVEFHASFLDGAPVPAWLCGGKLGEVSPHGTWEIAYNELANRLGLSLPHTKNLVTKIRPTTGDHHMSWESMTHAQVGWAGLK
jgi:hypothetical protein